LTSFVNNPLNFLFGLFQVFNREGQFERRFILNQLKASTLTVDIAGRIIIADYTSCCIYILDPILGNVFYSLLDLHLFMRIQGNYQIRGYQVFGKCNAFWSINHTLGFQHNG